MRVQNICPLCRSKAGTRWSLPRYQAIPDFLRRFPQLVDVFGLRPLIRGEHCSP